MPGSTPRRPTAPPPELGPPAEGGSASVDLAWLLEQPELGLHLIAGPRPTADGRRRSELVRGVAVSWAHSIELVDPTPWLDGGELVLTTGQFLSRRTRDLAAYVDRLAGAGVAALGFGVGLRFEWAPAVLIRRCDEVGLPLVEVPLATPFMAVTRAVADRLAKDREDRLLALVAAQGRVTSAARTRGVVALAAQLAREIGRPVVIVDEYAVPLAFHGVARPVAEAVASACRRMTSVATTPVPAPPGLDGPDSWTVELLDGRHARRGWLAVGGVGARLDPHVRLLLNHATSVATLHLDHPREVEDAFAGAGGVVLSALLRGTPGLAGPGGLELVHHFGISRSEVVVALAVDATGSGALAGVHARLERAGLPRLATPTTEDLIVVVRADDTADALACLRDPAPVGTHPPVQRLGIGTRTPLAEVATSVTAARQALASGRRLGQEVVDFAECPFDLLTGDPGVRAGVTAVAVPLLRPLLSSPGSDRDDLRAALGAYLDHHGGWEAAARSLGIHRHTLHARIGKVARLLGLDLDDADNRSLLRLALRVTEDGVSGRPRPP